MEEARGVMLLTERRRSGLVDGRRPRSRADATGHSLGSQPNSPCFAAGLGGEQGIAHHAWRTRAEDRHDPSARRERLFGAAAVGRDVESHRHHPSTLSGFGPRALTSVGARAWGVGERASCPAPGEWRCSRRPERGAGVARHLAERGKTLRDAAPVTAGGSAEVAERRRLARLRPTTPNHRRSAADALWRPGVARRSRASRLCPLATDSGLSLSGAPWERPTVESYGGRHARATGEPAVRASSAGIVP
jgi:hypothetical protein